jgi:hypothetical protein
MRRTLAVALLVASLGLTPHRPLVLVGQAPAPGPPRSTDFSTDPQRIESLRREGIHVEREGYDAWLAKELTSEQRERFLTDVDRALRAIRQFLGLPRPWQKPSEKVEIYVHPDRFVSHVNPAAQMLLSTDLVALGRAPVAHEVTHALLTSGTTFKRPAEQRPTWLPEGHAEFVAKTVAKQEGLHDADIFGLGTVDNLHSACRNSLPAMQEFDALRVIGNVGAPEALRDTNMRARIAPAFYGCAASFTKFLADQIGVPAVTDLLHEFDPRPAMERATGRSIVQSQQDWQREIGIVAK